jgi:uncharacterized membrane protein YkvA (DUF1232 family)
MLLVTDMQVFKNILFYVVLQLLMLACYVFSPLDILPEGEPAASFPETL